MAAGVPKETLKSLVKTMKSPLNMAKHSDTWHVYVNNLFTYFWHLLAENYFWY